MLNQASNKRAVNSESKDILQRYGSEFDHQGYIKPVKIIFEGVKPIRMNDKCITKNILIAYEMNFISLKDEMFR